MRVLEGGNLIKLNEKELETIVVNIICLQFCQQNIVKF